jgi:hypothetical protein
MLISSPNAQDLIDAIGPVDPTCNGVENLPDLEFTFDRHPLRVPWWSYIIRIPDKSRPGLMKCRLGIKPSEGPNQWLLGDAFLRAFYTVFDYETRQVGFSHLKSDKRRK